MPPHSFATTRSPAHPSRRLNLVAAVAFILGGSLFALGALAAQLGTVPLMTVNLTYLTGGFFFSLGGFVSVLLAPDHDRAWRGAVILFVGTLLFAVSLVAAFAQGLTPRQSNGWIWLPDILGCVCFLASGQLALREVGPAPWRVRLGESDWWLAAVNQLGSVLFFLAGLAAFTRPATSEEVNIGLVNWGTFAGAICFAAGGVIQSFINPSPNQNGGSATHDQSQ